MKNTTWNTYKITCYTHDVSQDQRSAGQTHSHQVRRTKGGWQHRIQQGNGRYTSFGEVSAMIDPETRVEVMLPHGDTVALPPQRLSTDQIRQVFAGMGTFASERSKWPTLPSQRAAHLQKQRAAHRAHQR
jgi:hypothetical protein